MQKNSLLSWLRLYMQITSKLKFSNGDMSEMSHVNVFVHASRAPVPKGLTVR